MISNFFHFHSCLRQHDKRQVAGESCGGFTLIEMLVVIAILALLISLLVPVTTIMFENAKRTTCLGQMRQIGQASMLYAADHEGILEGAYSYTVGSGAANRRHWYYYLVQENEYLNVEGVNERVLRCPNNDAGVYGMYTSKVTGGCGYAPDMAFMFREVPGVDWPNDPGWVGGVRNYFRLLNVPTPANTLLITCTSISTKDNNKHTGSYLFDANGPWNFNTNRGTTLWFAHGKKGANGMFMDGHAQVCSPEKLLNVDNHPKCNAEKGIRVWKLPDAVTKVEDGVEVP
ncbi:prepilin-type N-terminal cleavage/methylation domain-containing protein [Kiritimatiellota bacterium B12222]|nr:prepilin-type N-terminal cleavage/methylation domain-containing protein [Kiritimatiellota bacterium B12222]